VIMNLQQLKLGIENFNCWKLSLWKTNLNVQCSMFNVLGMIGTTIKSYIILICVSYMFYMNNIYVYID
jgi:hypothetical protein